MNYRILLILILLFLLIIFLYKNNSKKTIESYSNSCGKPNILNKLCTISLTDKNNNYNSTTINTSSIGIKIQKYTQFNNNIFYKDSLVYVGNNSILNSRWYISGGSLNNIKIINAKYNLYLGFGDLDKNKNYNSIYVTSTYNIDCSWKLINSNCSNYYIKHIKTGLYLYSSKPNINNTFVDQQKTNMYYKFGILTCNIYQQPWLILPQKPINIKKNNPTTGINRWTFNDAIYLCNNIGMQLCDSKDMSTYSNLNYSNCNCSWLKDVKNNTVNTGYIMGNKSGCGKKGINYCGRKNVIKSKYMCDRITWYITGDKFGNRWKTAYLPQKIPWQIPIIQKITIGKIGAILYAVVKNAQNKNLKYALYIQLFFKGSPFTGNISNVKLLCNGSGVTCCPKPIFLNVECIDFGNLSWTIDDQWYNQLLTNTVGTNRIFPFFYNKLKNKPNGTSVMGKICNNSNTFINTGNGMVLSGTKYNDSGYYLEVLYSNDGKSNGQKKFIYFSPPVYHKEKCSGNNTYFNFPSIKSTKILKTFPKPPCKGMLNYNSAIAGAPFYKILGSRQNCIKACQNMKNCIAATGKMKTNTVNKYNKGTNYTYCWLNMKGGPGKYGSGYNGWWAWRKINCNKSCIPCGPGTEKCPKICGYCYDPNSNKMISTYRLPKYDPKKPPININGTSYYFRQGGRAKDCPK